jgi:hypothetical protein
VTRALVLVAALASPAFAQDQFEIQVYDADSAPRGELGLELHANQHVIDRAANESHLTFEPHVGALDWLEPGAYFQTSLATSGELAYAGIKVRLKARWPHRLWSRRVGLAINGELSDVPARFEPNRYGSELRPIADVELDRIYAAVNPIVSIDLSGKLAGHPQLEPCAKLAAKATPALAIGVEAYTALGPIDDLGSEHVFRVLGAVDILGSWWSVDLAAGWTWGTADHAVVKMIFAVHT